MRLVGEELPGRVDRHPQHVGDVLVAVLDLQRLRVVAGPVAGRARRVDARQEEQLDHHEALALAGLAAALGDVEREPPGVVAAGPAPPWSPRRACGRGRTARCRWPGSSAACGRSASGRPRTRRLIASIPAAIRPPSGGHGRPLQLRRLPPRPAARSWPSCSATSSTSAWLTRLDLPEPETPVTVVNTPSGKAASSPCRLLRVTPASRSQPSGVAGRPSAAAALARTGSAGSATPRPVASPSGGPL